MRIWYKEPNGELLMDMWYGYCEYCGEYIHESFPHERMGELLICCDCAFINGIWTEEDYLKAHCFCNTFIKRAAVRDGKIYLTDKKFPWEKTKKQQRHTPEYIAWRTAVFERDKYTCAICGQVGGELNAHHIRPFKDFPKLRTDINNGVTLCKECHKRVHKEKDSEWIHPAKQKHTGKRNME